MEVDDLVAARLLEAEDDAASVVVKIAAELGVVLVGGGVGLDVVDAGMLETGGRGAGFFLNVVDPNLPTNADTPAPCTDTTPLESSVLSLALLLLSNDDRSDTDLRSPSLGAKPESFAPGFGGLGGLFRAGGGGGAGRLLLVLLFERLEDMGGGGGGGGKLRRLGDCV